jgi:hypothetical protein
MPNFGMSIVRSEIAVTRPFFRSKVEPLKVFSRFRIDIAVSGWGGTGILSPVCSTRFLHGIQERFVLRSRAS